MVAMPKTATATPIMPANTSMIALNRSTTSVMP